MHCGYPKRLECGRKIWERRFRFRKIGGARTHIYHLVQQEPPENKDTQQSRGPPLEVKPKSKSKDDFIVGGTAGRLLGYHLVPACQNELREFPTLL